jgi:RNA polymerase sigma-70 factor (ECF subfamily)
MPVSPATIRVHQYASSGGIVPSRIHRFSDSHNASSSASALLRSPIPRRRAVCAINVDSLFMISALHPSTSDRGIGSAKRTSQDERRITPDLGKLTVRFELFFRLVVTSHMFVPNDLHDGLTPVTQSPGDVTGLLMAMRDGVADARSRLIELLHRELAQLARRYMRRERPNHTLQATALVNEAYIRLLGREPVDWRNRAHFLAHAARAMRQVLVDHARGRRADKRGGQHNTVSIDDDGALSGSRLAERLASPDPGADVLALSDALDELARLDPRQASIVELRYFGGLTEQDIGELLGVTPRTVRRDWSTARLWLRRHIERQWA